jgi:hypothetical protein
MPDGKFIPPEPSKSDAAYAAGRALLSTIPVAGGAAVELFQFIVTPPIERRRNEWMKEIGQAVQTLEQNKGIDIEQLKSNDVFIDTLLQASQVALRNSQQDKLTALKNAVINSALPQPIEQTLQQMFLEWIDAFTVWHIRVLHLFHDPQQWAIVNNKPLPTNIAMGGLDTIFDYAYPELAKDRALYDQIWNDLYQKGLLNTDTNGLHTTMTWHGMLARRTTELGEKFLAFISEQE